MTRWWGVVGAVLLVVGLVVGAPGVATACACGAMVSSGDDARVTGEQALLSTDGSTETVIMRLTLSSMTDEGGLIVPTPAPATASLAGESVFDTLASLTAPRVETRRRWLPDFDFCIGGGVRHEAACAAPTVLAQVQLGPVEATTLAGGDLTGVTDWLKTHGYTMRDDVVDTLGPYLQQGWAFVAMRLTSQAPINGQVSVKLTFAADQLVYPMRMSAAAQTAQSVVIYTLGEHRMQRSDPDAAAQQVEVDYAGLIAGRTSDPELTELSSHGTFLTKLSVQINNPASITSDFQFVPAANDDPYQQVSYREVNLFGYVVLAMYLVAVAVALVVVVWLIRRVRRRAARS